MRDISKEKLEERIEKFEYLGWKSKNKSDSFNIHISAYSPTNCLWTESNILEYKEKLGFLFGEAQDAQRYINLVKIHYKKYPEEWKDKR